MPQNILISYDIYIDSGDDGFVKKLWLAHSEFDKTFLNEFVGNPFSLQLLHNIREKIATDQKNKHERGIITLRPLQSSLESRDTTAQEKNWFTIYTNYQIKKGAIEWCLPKIGYLGAILGGVIGILFDAIAMLVTESNKKDTGVGVGVTGAVAGGIMLILTFKITGAYEKLGIVGRKADTSIRNIGKKLKQLFCNNTSNEIITPVIVRQESTAKMLARLGGKAPALVGFGAIALFDGLVTGNGIYQEIDLVTQKFVSEYQELAMITPEIIHYIALAMAIIAFTATSTFDISILAVVYQYLSNIISNQLDNTNMDQLPEMSPLLEEDDNYAPQSSLENETSSEKESMTTDDSLLILKSR